MRKTRSFILTCALVSVFFMAFGVENIYSSPNLQGGGTHKAFVPVVKNDPGSDVQSGNSLSAPVSHDAYVKSEQPQNNYGSEKVLQVRDATDNNDYHSYLNFNVTGVSGNVIEARLRLYATDGNSEGISIHSVANTYRNSSEPWIESGLTWENAPALGQALSTVRQPIIKNSWMELDVTSAIAGDGVYSFALKNLSQDSVYYNSGEANNRQPVLVVIFDGVAEPNVTPPPTATQPPPTPTPAPTDPPDNPSPPTPTPAPTDPPDNPSPPTPTPAPTDPPDNPSPTAGEMWISHSTLGSLPTSGTAWNNVLDAAQNSTNLPNVSDQNDSTDAYVLAKALVYARTGETQYRNEVMTAIGAAMGTETGSGILAVARNIQAYVIAADLINLRSVNPQLDTAFQLWLSTIRHVVFDGAGPALSIISCHELRPNNFGTHCGASRIAIALYLNDTSELQNAANVFKGWVGDRSAYSGFDYGELDWQCDNSTPVGINPAGCTKSGHSVDGVLPDDQRRSGGFSWPPPQENYVWEALQGAGVQAELLTRAGYPAWQWQQQALLRAINWLHQEADYPATGDDTWLPWLFNYAYGTNFPAPSSTTPGKGMGWTEWTHGEQ